MDFEKLIQMRNEKNIFAKHLGIKITKIEPGKAEAEVTVTEHLLNLIDSIHGGCLYTLADVAAGSVAASYGIKMTTLGSDMHYLNPGLDCTKVYAHAEAVKRGKKVCVIHIDLYDQKTTLLATATFTFMSLGVPIELD